MAHIPTQVSALLRDLTVHLPVILGRNLVGLYIYGSLTQRAFNPKRSDVDCIVVTQRDLSDTQFKKLEAWLARATESNHWVARLQILFLIRDEVLTIQQALDWLTQTRRRKFPSLVSRSLSILLMFGSVLLRRSGKMSRPRRLLVVPM